MSPAPDDPGSLHPGGAEPTLAGPGELEISEAELAAARAARARARERARHDDDPGRDPGAPVEDEAPPPPARDRPKRRSTTRNLLEWVAVLGGAVLVAVVLRSVVLQQFWIPSPSMATTLEEHDRVLVNKLSYRLHDVNRGDVVVFERPPNEPDSDIKDLIKRVVALEGERVSILEGRVLIDGRVLEEPYVDDQPTEPTTGCGAGEVAGLDTAEGLEVPEDHVFVLGDNRTNSHDGRCFGPISEELIVGRAFLVIWPPSKIGAL